MTSSWRKAAFKEFCDITRGASPRPIHDYLGAEGMPWIKIADATAESSRYITKTKEKIKLDGVRASVEVFPGDLILSNSATPGLPKFLKINACIHDGWMVEELLSACRLQLFPLSNFVHHLTQRDRLGIIPWLLHCSSLAFCARTWCIQGLA